MEVPTASPAPAPAAPPPSAPPSAPASTPSTPAPTATPYGKLNPSDTQAIFSRLDAETGAAEQPPAEIPVARVPGTPEPAPAEAAPVEAVPAAETPELESDPLPQNVRDALKVIPDKKLQDALAEAYYVTRDLKKSGTPVASIRQFIQDAPKYLQYAPSVEVLEHMAKTAEFANDLGEGFNSGQVDGFKKFTGALLQSNVGSFVGLTDFILRNSDHLSNGLAQHYGQDAAQQFGRVVDGFRDSGNLNVISNMRAKAAAAAEKGGNPDDEVWGEVADKMEEWLNLKPKNAQQGPQRQDPRDLRIQQLEAERQQQIATHVEQFTDGVFNTAGHQLQSEIDKFLGAKTKGYPAEAIADITKFVSDDLYGQLLHNKHIVARARALEQAGRYDRDHSQKLTNFYVEQGKRLIANVAGPVLDKYSKITAPRLQADKERLQQHMARRDPGASGAPRTDVPVKPLSSAATAKELFALLDQQAG